MAFLLKGGGGAICLHVKMKHTTQLFDIVLLQVNVLLITVALLPATARAHTSQLGHCLCHRGVWVVWLHETPARLQFHSLL